MNSQVLPEVNVRVVFFASLRDAVGVAELDVQAATIGDVYAQLAKQLSADAYREICADNVRLALNQTLTESSDLQLAVSSGDEIAFLPPVTGG